MRVARTIRPTPRHQTPGTLTTPKLGRRPSRSRAGRSLAAVRRRRSQNASTLVGNGSAVSAWSDAFVERRFWPPSAASTKKIEPIGPIEIDEQRLGNRPINGIRRCFKASSITRKPSSAKANTFAKTSGRTPIGRRAIRRSGKRRSSRIASISTTKCSADSICRSCRRMRGRGKVYDSRQVHGLRSRARRVRQRCRTPSTFGRTAFCSCRRTSSRARSGRSSFVSTGSKVGRSIRSTPASRARSTTTTSPPNWPSAGS